MFDQEKAAALVVRETAIWRTLSHPNILPLTGLYWKDPLGLPAIVTPWQRDGNVHDYLQNRRFEPNIGDKYLQLLEGTLRGLAYIHEQGLVHRNVKGANILVSCDGAASSVS